MNPTAGRGYVYQDFQYFLRQGDGPWGGLTWTYDRIGNRLSEVRNGQPADIYHYVANPAGGHDPRLDRIVLGAGGMRTFEYDAPGNEIEIATGANVIERTYDDAGRLAEIKRAAGDVASDLRYDGRSFLRHAAQRSLSQIFDDGFETGNAACWSGAVGGAAGSGDCEASPVTEPVYSSEGLLHAQHKVEPDVDRYVFYFAGRPAATLADDGASATYLWLSTDHLGTPVLASRSTGALQWSGGFEPFGSDWLAQAPNGASDSGVFLRLRGQWQDSAWHVATEAESTAFNVMRWYDSRLGRFTQADPAHWFTLDHPYIGMGASPTIFTDSLGLFPEDRVADFGDRLGRDMREDVRCVARVRDEVRAGFQDQTRYQHCLANCRISTECPSNRLGAVVASLIKEVGDLIVRCLVQRLPGSCNSAFQPQDFEDNRRGRMCPVDTSCDGHCGPLLIEEEPPAGPFGRLGSP